MKRHSKKTPGRVVGSITALALVLPGLFRDEPSHEAWSAEGMAYEMPGSPNAAMGPSDDHLLAECDGVGYETFAGSPDTDRIAPQKPVSVSHVATTATSAPTRSFASAKTLREALAAPAGRAHRLFGAGWVLPLGLGYAAGGQGMYTWQDLASQLSCGLLLIYVGYLLHPLLQARRSVRGRSHEPKRQPIHEKTWV